MVETRLSSDPDLANVAEQLHGKDVAQLHKLAVVLCERGNELLSLNDALADKVADLLREGKKVPREMLEQLQFGADKADGDYLDILDAEGAGSSRCLEAFSKARLLMALSFAAEGSKAMLLDSVYESFIGTQRHPEMLEIIRSFALE